MKKIQSLFTPKIILLLIVFIGYLPFAHTLTGTFCPVYSLTGVPCPTCGITRASIAFLQGNFAKAFSLHPLFILGYVLLFIFILREFFSPSNFKKALSIVIIIGGAMFFAVYIYRMATLFPHTYPLEFKRESLIPRLVICIFEQFS